jgi:hypothetical protein
VTCAICSGRGTSPRSASSTGSSHRASDWSELDASIVLASPPASVRIATSIDAPNAALASARHAMRWSSSWADCAPLRWASQAARWPASQRRP